MQSFGPVHLNVYEWILFSILHKIYSLKITIITKVATGFKIGIDKHRGGGGMVKKKNATDFKTEKGSKCDKK